MRREILSYQEIGEDLNRSYTGVRNFIRRNPFPQRHSKMNNNQKIS